MNRKRLVHGRGGGGGSGISGKVPDLESQDPDWVWGGPEEQLEREEEGGRGLEAASGSHIALKARQEARISQ